MYYTVRDRPTFILALRCCSVYDGEESVSNEDSETIGEAHCAI